METVLTAKDSSEGSIFSNLVFQEELLSHSPKETMDWACRKGRIMHPPLTVVLTGSLGVGKTVVVRGLAAGLGIDDEGEVSSPSYTLLNSYQADCPIHHLDLYRLADVRDLENIGLFDLLDEQRSIRMIEWGELAFPWILHGVHIHIRDGGGEQRRILYRTF